MLIRFRVKNFLSFYDQVELSMIPGRVRMHKGHIITGNGKGGVDVLRSAIIYGANASGKSNLVKAMAFARDMILMGTHLKEAIPRKPFKLIQQAEGEPSRFEFEIQQETRAYGYGFELDSQRVHKEWLYELKKTTETMLFERETSPSGKTTVQFGKLKLQGQKEREFLEFVGMGTRPNQLFLTESMERDVDQFAEVVQWFLEKLVIIFPHSKYIPLGRAGADLDFGSRMVRYLEQLGTGICDFDLQDVNAEKEFPEDFLDAMVTVAQGEDRTTMILGPEDNRYVLDINKSGHIDARKLMLRHRMADGDEEALFEMHEESDGTRRMMDLLPTLGHPGEPGRVIVVDELDRSLHPALSYKLVALFLAAEGICTQLIATTHEEHLLTFDLLRRDEIWFIEKNQQGASQLYSLEEFAPRYDKDIEKGYMQGRFGGIPVFGNMRIGQAV